MVRFFIELSECKVNIAKIKSFQKNKEEFSKTKLKKLTNIIKIADIVSKGIMTFEQHEKFVKNGIKLFEEQMAENEKIKNYFNGYNNDNKSMNRLINDISLFNIEQIYSF